MDTFRFVPSNGPVQVRDSKGFGMLRRELEVFAASIEAKQPFPTPLDEVLHGVAVFEAVVRSAQSGRPEAVAAT